MNKARCVAASAVVFLIATLAVGEELSRLGAGGLIPGMHTTDPSIPKVDVLRIGYQEPIQDYTFESFDQLQKVEVRTRQGRTVSLLTPSDL